MDFRFRAIISGDAENIKTKDLAGWVVDNKKERIRLFWRDDTKPDGMATKVFDMQDIDIMLIWEI